MTLNNNNLLISSAREGDLSKVEKFLEKGADIDAKDNDGYTALHLAAKYGHLNVAEKLLEKGASFDIKTNRGYAPLQYTYFHMNPCKEHQPMLFLSEAISGFMIVLRNSTSSIVLTPVKPKISLRKWIRIFLFFSVPNTRLKDRSNFGSRNFERAMRK